MFLQLRKTDGVILLIDRLNLLVDLLSLEIDLLLIALKSLLKSIDSFKLHFLIEIYLADFLLQILIIAF